MIKFISKPFVAIGKWVRHHWKLSLILVVIIGGAGFWYLRSKQGSAAKVQTEHPQRGYIAQTIDVSGVVDAKEKASLRFAAGGKVVYLGAKEGDTVKKWQTIATIDARDLQNRMQQSLNTYFDQRMSFEQNADNRKDLAPTNALDRTSQTNQKDLETSVLNVQLGDIAIQNTVLSTPIGGVLVSSPTNVTGVNLFATDVFTIINPQTLIFKAAVDQADVSSVHKGQKVRIKLDAYPDEKIETTVNYISYSSSQSSTGTVYIVEMALPLGANVNPLERYRLGMNGDASLIMAEKDNVLTISLGDVKDKDGKKYVMVRSKQKGQPDQEREIQTGLENDTNVEVISGLTEQDEVVVP